MFRSVYASDGQAPQERPKFSRLHLKPASLIPFDVTGDAEWAVPFGFEGYLELVDWTGHTRGQKCRWSTGYIYGFFPDN